MIIDHDAFTDPFEWVDPFLALEHARALSRIDYDYQREVDEERQRLRERYAAENAYFRAQVDHLTKEAVVLGGMLSGRHIFMIQGESDPFVRFTQERLLRMRGEVEAMERALRDHLAQREARGPSMLDPPVKP